MRYVIDTNVLIRYFVGDVSSHKSDVDSLFRQIDDEECEAFIPNEVICEMTYVLTKQYGYDRTDMVRALRLLLSSRISFVNKQVVENAVLHYVDSDLDIQDCFLVGYAKAQGYTIATFDKDLKKRSG
jgi:predicted nucleic-acid-binding protein